jgi:HEAT repeat protein
MVMSQRIAVFVSLVFLVACGPDLETDEGIRQALTDANVPSATAAQAVEKIKSMPGEKQKVFVPDLVTLHSSSRAPAGLFDLLVELRDPAAKPAYVSVLRDKEADNRTRAKAAIALGDIKATDHIDDLATMFRKVANEDLRRSILEAFTAMPDPAAFPVLLEILLNFDPDREPIAYHAYACEVIEATPGVTESVARAATYGMFLDNATNQNVYKECALAVCSAGPRATSEVVTVLLGKHTRINARFQKFPSYIKGNNEVKAADVLGLLRDPAAVDALLGIVTTKPVIPPGYRDQKLVGWASTRIQLFVYSAGALGDIGDPRAVEPLSKYVVQDKKVLEPFNDLIGYDPRSRHDIALAAIDALNTIGDRSGLPHLKRGIQVGDIPELKGFNPSFVYQSRWEAARAYARLATGAELEDYDALIAAEKVADVKKKLVEYRPMLEVAKECGDQAACYGRYLKGTDKLKAEKAAWELGRMEKGGAAEDELLASLGTENIELRKIIIKSLFRVGGKKTNAKVTEVLATEKSRKAPEFQDIHFKMKALRAHARNNG